MEILKSTLTGTAKKAGTKVLDGFSREAIGATPHKGGADSLDTEDVIGSDQFWIDQVNDPVFQHTYSER